MARVTRRKNVVFVPLCFHHVSACGLERQSVARRIGRNSASENVFFGDRESRAGIGKMEAAMACQEQRDKRGARNEDRENSEGGIGNSEGGIRKAGRDL